MEYAPFGLIGLLTPQANTTVEPEAWALLPTGYSLINARLVSQASRLNQRLLDYFDQLEISMLQFGNAPLSVLALACTGSSYLMGREQEAQWVLAWQARLNIPVIFVSGGPMEAGKVRLANPQTQVAPEHLVRHVLGYMRIDFARKLQCV